VSLLSGIRNGTAALTIPFLFLLFPFALANPPANQCGSLDADFNLTADTNSAPGTCFTVAANNITLDCQGYRVRYGASSAGYGVYVNSFFNVTVKNCNIVSQSNSGYHGILVLNANNITINLTNATARYYQGANFTNSSYNSITDSRFTSWYDDGFEGFALSYTNFTNVTITGGNGGGDYGLWLHDGSSYNNITNCTINVTVGGDIAVYLLNNGDYNTFDRNNLSNWNSNSVVYLYFSSYNNFTNNNISSNTAGGIYFISYSSFNLADNNSMASRSTGGTGLYLYDNSNFNVFTNNSVNYYSVAYYLNTFAWNNNASSNNFTSRYSYGVYFTSNNWNNILASNVILGGTGGSNFAVYLYGDSSYSTIYNNTIIARNGLGIYLNTYASYNNITNNTINATGGSGIGVATSCMNTTIVRNNITTNGNGIYVVSSSDNAFIQNNTIVTYANSAYGIQYNQASYGNVTGNSIDTYGSSSFGLYLPTTSSNTFELNTINSRSAIAVYLVSDSSNNNFTNNTIRAGSCSGCYGIYVATCSNNNFTNNVIISNVTTGDDGIYMTTSADSNYFLGNRINVTATNADGIVLTTTTTNNVFDRNSIWVRAAGRIGIYLTSNTNYNNFSNTYINDTSSTAIYITATSRYNRFYNTTAYGMGYAVYIYSSNTNYFYNTTATSNNSIAVYLDTYSQDNHFYNGLFASNQSYGLYLYNNAINNTFDNISIGSNKSYGFRLSTTSQTNNFTNISVRSNLSWSAYIDSNSHYNTFYDCNFTSNLTSGSGVLYISSSSGNLFYRTFMYASAWTNNYGVYFTTNADNNAFTDSLISAPGTGGYDVLSYGDSDNVFLNVSYDKTNAYFSDAPSSLNVSWYLEVTAKAFNGMALESANVSAKDKNNIYRALGYFTNYAGSSGKIPLLEYVQTLSGSTTYYPYTAYATLTSATNSSPAVTLITNSQATVYLNSSTCDNLTGNVTLRNNVYADGTCFTTGADYLTINCAGYSINYSRSEIGYALDTNSSSNVTLKNCTVKQRGANIYSHAIYWSGGRNNSVENVTVTMQDAYAFFLTNSSVNNSIVSSSYSYPRTWFNDSASSLTREWYALVMVRDYSQVGFEGATVTAKDASNSTWYSLSTNSTGHTSVMLLRETFQTQNGTSYYIPYVFNASSGVISNSTSVNLTSNRYNVYIDMDVTTCRNLTTNYTLTNDVYANTNCFAILAAGTTLDCAGYSVYFSRTGAGQGVHILGANGSNVRNCRLQRSAVYGGAYGVIVNSSDRALVANSTFSFSGLPDLRITNSKNTTFLNTSDQNLQVVMEDGSSNFTRSWYANVQVLGLANEQIANATLQTTNYQGQTEFSATANQNGTHLATVRQYQQEPNSTTYFSPLNFSATHPQTEMSNYSIIEMDQSKTVTLGVVSAALNITEPTENEVFFQGQMINITVNETKGPDWIGNVKVYVYNDGRQLTYQMTEISPNLWIYYYPIDPSISARTVYMTAFGINGTANVTANRAFVVTRSPGGGIEAPTMRSMWANQTYALQNQTVYVNATADLDTIIYEMTANMTLPNGTSLNLSASNLSGEETTYVYSGIFDVYLPLVGNYTVTATARDVNDQTASQTITFFADNRTNNVTMNFSGITDARIYDNGSNIFLANASAGNFTLIPGRYRVLFETEGPRVTLVNALLDASTSGGRFAYQNLTQISYSAPQNRRYIRIFRLNSTMTFDTVEFYYGYTPDASTLVAEAGLELRKCEETNGSCAWQLLNFTLNTTTNEINASSNSTSIWALFEPAFPEPQTVTVSQPVPVPVPVTKEVEVYKDKIVETPVKVPYEVEKQVSPHLFMAAEPVEVYQTGKAGTTLRLQNSGTGDFGAISFTVESGDAGLAAAISPDAIAGLAAGSTTTAEFSVTATGAQLGQHKVTILAKSGDYTDRLEVAVNVVKYTTAERVEAAKSLEFARKFNRQNPECLEFEYNLDLSAKAYDSDEINQSLSASADALNGCKATLNKLRSEPDHFAGMFLGRTAKLGDVNSYVIAGVVGAAAAVSLVLLRGLLTPKKSNTEFEEQGGE
jgi:hypothetical protein